MPLYNPISNSDLMAEGEINKYYTASREQELSVYPSNKKAISFGSLLKNKMLPSSLTIMGDSTANETSEWFYLTMQAIGAKHPYYTFKQRLWSDAKQHYGASTVMQYGAEGEAYLLSATGATGSIKTASSTALQITGDLEVVVKVRADTFLSAGGVGLAGKFGEAGDRGWALCISPSGLLYFWWSADGTNLVGNASTSASVSLESFAGQDIWIKATLDVDNGASGSTANYYTSTDGTTFTQLGNSMVQSPATAIYANTADLMIGGRFGGASFIGRIYEAYIKNGIDGVIVASPDLGQAFPSVVTSFTDSNGNSWAKSDTPTWGNGSPSILLHNASHPGAVIAYSADEARFALQMAKEPIITMINYSHNDNADVYYYTAYEALISQIETKWAHTGVVVSTQNPKTSPASSIKQHDIRNHQIIDIASIHNTGLIDPFSAIIATDSVATYTSPADGVHTTAAGNTLWRDEALKFFKPVMQ